MFIFSAVVYHANVSLASVVSQEGKMVLLFLVYHPFLGDVVASRLVKLISRSKKRRKPVCFFPPFLCLADL